MFQIPDCLEVSVYESKLNNLDVSNRIDEWIVDSITMNRNESTFILLFCVYVAQVGFKLTV